MRSARPGARNGTLVATLLLLVAGSCGSESRSQATAPVARLAPVTTTTRPSSATTAPARTSTPTVAARHSLSLRRPAARRHSYAGRVTAIGDSVMLDAAPVLQASIPAIDIDASTDRAVETGIGVLAAKADPAAALGAIAFHLGNNSSFSASQVDHVLQIAAGRPVVLITDHCAYCSWVPANNLVIHHSCTRVRRCTVADWDALADAHPAWFTADGVHMPIGGAGARAYAHLVVDGLSAP